MAQNTGPSALGGYTHTHMIEPGRVENWAGRTAGYARTDDAGWGDVRGMFTPTLFLSEYVHAYTKTMFYIATHNT